MVDLKASSKPVLPLYVWNWIFGIGVIEYPIGNPHPKLSFVYAFLLFTIYIVITVMGYSYINDVSSAKSSIGVSIKVLTFSNILTTFSIITLGWGRSELLHKCLLKSSEADTMMATIGIHRNYSKLMRIQIRKTIAGSAILLTIMTVNSFLVTANIQSVTAKALASFSMSFPVLVAYVADATFVNIINSIRDKFILLNERLRSLLTNSANTPQHRRVANKAYEFKQRCNATVVKTAKQVHIQLIKVCEDVNKAYGLQVLLSIIVASTGITVQVYLIYSLLIVDSLPHKVTRRLVTAAIIWITYYTAKISCFSNICSDCVQQAIKTGDVINELYDDPVSSDESKYEIRTFNVQMLQNPLKFTASGFINLDFTLVQTMISSITTYSMIIIQLGKLPSTANGNR